MFDPELDIMLPELAEVFQELVYAALPVFGNNGQCPAGTHMLVHGPSGPVEPGLIDIGVITLRVRHPERRGCCTGKIPQPELALLQSLFYSQFCTQIAYSGPATNHLSKA